MNVQKQREALAKVEGWDTDPEGAREWGSRGQWCIKGTGVLVSKNMHLPKYLTSHDAIQRVVDGLDDEQLSWYDESLRNITRKQYGNAGYLYPYKATPAQKCEAVLKALGLWEGSSIDSQKEEKS